MFGRLRSTCPHTDSPIRQPSGVSKTLSSYKILLQDSRRISYLCSPFLLFCLGKILTFLSPSLPDQTYDGHTPTPLILSLSVQRFLPGHHELLIESRPRFLYILLWFSHSERSTLLVRWWTSTSHSTFCFKLISYIELLSGYVISTEKQTHVLIYQRFSQSRESSEVHEKFFTS